MRTMSLFLFTTFLLAAAFLPANAQIQDTNHNLSYMDHAEIQHGPNSATVVANSPRPLEQAVQAVSEEYGWTIDFEDPPYYSKHDLVYEGDPAWRAQHPDAKGVSRIRSGEFRSQFSESPDTRNSAAEQESILKQMAADYNQSGNPGNFSVRSEGRRWFSIVGTAVADDTGAFRQIPPILDTRITISAKGQDAASVLKLILSEVSAQRGARVLLGVLPANIFRSTSLASVDAHDQARVLLRMILETTGTKLSWKLLFDNNTKVYYFNVLRVEQAQYDASGNRTTVWVK
jgi:hypothetical protein